MHTWVLEEFDRGTRRFLRRRTLVGFTDEDARSLLGLGDLGDGDLFDLPRESFEELSSRFDIADLSADFEYLLGRESSQPRTG